MALTGALPGFVEIKKRNLIPLYTPFRHCRNFRPSPRYSASPNFSPACNAVLAGIARLASAGHFLSGSCGQCHNPRDPVEPVLAILTFYRACRENGARSDPQIFLLHNFDSRGFVHCRGARMENLLCLYSRPCRKTLTLRMFTGSSPNM